DPVLQRLTGIEPDHPDLFTAGSRVGRLRDEARHRLHGRGELLRELARAVLHARANSDTAEQADHHGGSPLPSDKPGPRSAMPRPYERLRPPVQLADPVPGLDVQS